MIIDPSLFVLNFKYDYTLQNKDFITNKQTVVRLSINKKKIKTPYENVNVKVLKTSSTKKKSLHKRYLTLFATEEQETEPTLFYLTRLNIIMLTENIIYFHVT